MAKLIIILQDGDKTEQIGHISLNRKYIAGIRDKEFMHNISKLVVASSNGMSVRIE